MDAVKKLKLEIATPEKFMFKGDVEMVIIPGSDGEFAVLTGHIPLISSIRSGFIQILHEGVVVEKLFVIDGFVEVTFSSAVVLIDRALSVLNVKESEILKKIEELEILKIKDKQEFDEYSLNKDIEFYQKLHENLLRH